MHKSMESQPQLIRPSSSSSPSQHTSNLLLNQQQTSANNSNQNQLKRKTRKKTPPLPVQLIRQTSPIPPPSTSTISIDPLRQRTIEELLTLPMASKNNMILRI